MKYLLCLSLTLMASSCSYLNLWPDNPVEEAVENIIEEQTGVNVDFTGSSPESN